MFNYKPNQKKRVCLRKQHLIEALLHLKQYGPSDETNGICYNVELLFVNNNWEFDKTQFDLITHPIFKRWSEFSGEIHYPVPGGMDAYDFAPGSHWVGEYGESRLRLLDFMIQELTKEMK